MGIPALATQFPKLWVSDFPSAVAKNPTALESNLAAAVSQLIINMSVTPLQVHRVTAGKWLASLWRA